MGSIDKENVAPPAVSTDDILPMSEWDDQPHNREVVVEVTYRFDDVLDNGKLKRSLGRLLEIGKWKKLGARIRLNSDGKLDYHVPERYDENRPGFLWAHQEFAQPIEEHLLASQLPQSKSEPTVHGDSMKFQPLTAHQDHPTRLSDWIHSDAPPLSIKLTTFSNASLLSLSWSHTFLDALGLQTLLKAWILVLNDREQELPEFIGYKDDPETALGLDALPEKHVLYPRLVPDAELPVFINSLIQEQKRYPVETARMIQLPNHFVQGLKRDAINHLSKNNEQEPPFLSDGDVLFAWIVRLTFSAQASSYDLNRTVNLLNVFNYRGIASSLPIEKAYVGNAVSAAQTHLAIRQLIDEHYAVTALQIRSDLLAQKTEEQLEAAVALGRKLGHGPLFGTADQVSGAWSNWHRCKFYELDFSSAVVEGSGQGDERDGYRRGRPTYIHVCGHRGNFSTRNGGALLGRDANDNWWISWTLREQAWDAFEAKFYELTRGRTDGGS